MMITAEKFLKKAEEEKKDLKKMEFWEIAEWSKESLGLDSDEMMEALRWADVDIDGKLEEVKDSFLSKFEYVGNSTYILECDNLDDAKNKATKLKEGYEKALEALGIDIDEGYFGTEGKGKQKEVWEMNEQGFDSDFLDDVSNDNTVFWGKASLKQFAEEEEQDAEKKKEMLTICEEATDDSIIVEEQGEWEVLEGPTVGSWEQYATFAGLVVRYENS